MPAGRPRSDVSQKIRFDRPEVRRIVRGQTVTIQYDREFEKEYPATFAMMNGKTGIAESFMQEGAGTSLVRVKLAFSEVVTLVEQRHLVGTGMPA